MTRVAAGTRPDQGLVTDEDVMAAQALLDALMEAVADRRPGEGFLLQVAGMGPEWRGIIGAWAADVRLAGYLEGMLRGRRQVAGWVRDALAGEGL